MAEDGDEPVVWMGTEKKTGQGCERKGTVEPSLPPLLLLCGCTLHPGVAETSVLIDFHEGKDGIKVTQQPRRHVLPTQASRPLLASIGYEKHVLSSCIIRNR